MIRSVVPFAAAVASTVLASAVLFRRRYTAAAWLFFAGMTTLAVESVLFGWSALDPARAVQHHANALIAQSFLPISWALFSVVYSRGNYREYLFKWRFLLALALLLPVGVALAWKGELLVSAATPSDPNPWPLRYQVPGTLLNVLLLLANCFVLLNLEQTFRATVGTSRWRVKFVILGLAVLFGTRIYTGSQTLIFHAVKPEMSAIDSAALLIACGFMVLAYLRQGFAEIDVYPSQALVQSSVTVMLVGGYLLGVGLLAQAVRILGREEYFEARAFLILLAAAALAVLLFSDRLRERIRNIVSRHLKRPYHDVRLVWTRLSASISKVQDQADLCRAAGNLISKTFHVHSVSTWIHDEQNQRLLLGASTSQLGAEKGNALVETLPVDPEVWRRFNRDEAFDLDDEANNWAAFLREASLRQFRSGGHRLCIPLLGGGSCLGLFVLADRVNGLPYTGEESELLNCIAEQVAATLLNLRLREELMLAKQLEAFQAMSTFFVHDLKNAANSLNLTLQNLPIHFNDPEFRQDALRGMTATVNRIKELIVRLSLLREKLEVNRLRTDLNEIVGAAIKGLNGLSGFQVVTELQPLPEVLVDAEKIQGVVTNLLLNAQDAAGPGGRIKIETYRHADSAILSVSDNGCGMSPDFLREGLFRPFQTTKKKGLGIGMFQSKAVVTAHQGRLQVESELGKGTTFRVTLPMDGGAE